MKHDKERNVKLNKVITSTPFLLYYLKEETILSLQHCYIRYERSYKSPRCSVILYGRRVLIPTLFCYIVWERKITLASAPLCYIRRERKNISQPCSIILDGKAAITPPLLCYIRWQMSYNSSPVLLF